LMSKIVILWRDAEKGKLIGIATVFKVKALQANHARKRVANTH